MSLGASPRPEIQRRQSNADKVWAVFEARPTRWIHWRRFAAVGGACAWRTRIADVRARVKSLGGVIEHNGSITRSAYRYLPYTPLGRSADVPAPDRWPAYDAPIQETFRLT